MKTFKTNSKNFDIARKENEEIKKLALSFVNGKLKCEMFFEEGSILPSTIAKMMVKTKSGSIYRIELETNGFYYFYATGKEPQKVCDVLCVAKAVLEKDDILISTDIANARLYVDMGEDWVTTSAIKEIIVYTKNGTFYGIEHLEEYQIA